jgi:hypothetical protein
MTATVPATRAPAPPRSTLAVLIGVLAGFVWLAAFALATAAGWTQLRDRRRPAPPPNRWTTAAAWTLAAGLGLTITIVVTGAAS